MHAAQLGCSPANRVNLEAANIYISDELTRFIRYYAVLDLASCMFALARVELEYYSDCHPKMSLLLRLFDHASLKHVLSMACRHLRAQVGSLSTISVGPSSGPDR